MIESSPVKSSAMTSNIDIAVVITSPSSKPSQTAFIESFQVFIETFINRIFKKHIRKIEQKRRPIIDGERKLLRDYFFKEKSGKIIYKNVIK